VTQPSTTPAAGRAAPRGRPRDPGADQAILHATFEQLLEVGYGGLSMEAVAAAAGVAKTTVYRRYPSKRDLVIAALGRSVPFEPPAHDLMTPDALRALVHEAVAMLVDSGAIRILASLLVEAQRDPTILDAFRARLLEPRRHLIVAMLERGIERGELRSDTDPLVVTEMIAGAVFGHHAILGQPTTEAWVDALVEHVWAAIRA
jgi:AcrR family transcriptional regulator